MEEQFDAIVIGSGISGGWAAKELCDKGLKVLLLERGRDVVHLKDYPTATKDPWQLAHRGEMPPSVLKENPIVAKCYAFGEATEHFFVKDKEHPYIQEKPFDWIRAYQVAANHCYGQDKYNAGANSNLMHPQEMVMQRHGQLTMMIWRPGIVMLKNLQASVVIKMDWKIYPMVNFYRHGI